MESEHALHQEQDSGNVHRVVTTSDPLHTCLEPDIWVDSHSVLFNSIWCELAQLAISLPALEHAIRLQDVSADLWLSPYTRV